MKRTFALPPSCYFIFCCIFRCFIWGPKIKWWY